MWVLDFVQERFHEVSPADTESVFIKAGDSETRAGLGLKEPQDSLGGIALALWKRSGNEGSQGKAVVNSLESQRKGGLGDRVRGLALDYLPAAAHCSPGYKLCGDPRSLVERKFT